MNRYYVYILASRGNQVLYIGATNDLERRLYEHQNGRTLGFAKKYKTHELVYFEETSNIRDALTREKQLKAWRRKWKIDLIKTLNPSMKDLSKKLHSLRS